MYNIRMLNYNLILKIPIFNGILFLILFSQFSELSSVKIRQRTARLNVSLYHIKPLPSISEDSPPKKRYRRKSAILKSSEYRQELKEKKNKTQAKKKAPQSNKKKVVESKTPKNSKKKCLKSKK